MNPTVELPPARRPDVRSWARLVAVEARMVWRDPGGLIIPVGLPLLIMVMNGLGAADQPPMDELGGFRPFDAIVVPLTLAMVIALIGLVNMPSFIATYRRAGVLRRLAVTPAHPGMVLVAQVVVSAAQATLGIVLALGIARSAFDLVWPARPWVAVGVLLLAAGALYALGMVIAAISPTPNAAIAIGMLLFFAMLALGGGLGPADALPDGLRTLGEWLPYGAASEGIGAAWRGETVEGAHLLALGATVVLAAAGSVWRFRWE